MIDDFLLNQYWSLSIPPENKKEPTVFLRFFRMGGEALPYQCSPVTSTNVGIPKKLSDFYF